MNRQVLCDTIRRVVMIFFEGHLALRSQTYGRVHSSCQSKRTKREFDRRGRVQRKTIVTLVGVMRLQRSVRTQPESAGRMSGNRILRSLQTRIVIGFGETAWI